MNGRCEVFILMGKTDPDSAHRHKQQSMILVQKNTHCVTIVRDLALLGVGVAPRHRRTAVTGESVDH